MVAAHRQVTEFDSRLATMNKQKIFAVESHKKLLQSLRATTGKAFKAGVASQIDVLAIEVELSKLDLWLLELKDN